MIRLDLATDRLVNICQRRQLAPDDSPGIPDDTVHTKLQALVYDILPSTTAVFSYAIGSRKLSANGQ